MKLSQKLLGLAGLAMADYACCPYDDYGMPEPQCAGILTEKTPFDSSANWEGNACKAWETNVDATYEGNSRSSGCADYNWGSCGFQRHFPWKVLDDTDRAKLSLGDSTTNNLSMTVDISSQPNTGAFATGSTLSTAEAQYKVGAAPFLGGICKLFIPAQGSDIVQVQVAGVHKPAGFAQFPAQTSANGNNLAGTVYCFGVANIAETMDNTNLVMNGNVAGAGKESNAGGRIDPFAALNSLNRQAGVAYTLSYGSDLVAEDGSRSTTNGEAIVSAGANFDVVAHFSDTWCETKFGAATSIAEMQLTGDENAGDANYPYDQSSSFSHAHNDVLDKRHATLGYGNTYVASSTSGYIGKTNAEEYKWPNAGAWAAFYSHIMCAKSTPSSAFVTGTHTAQNLWSDGTRAGVLSVSAGDYRRNDDGQSSGCASDTVSHRFNLRQIGTQVEPCGPGTMPDSSNTPIRCTWNWNYSPGAYGSTNAADPEGFFDRTDQLVVDTWSRKRRAAVDRSTQLGGNTALAGTDFVAAVSFRDNAGANLTPITVTPDSARVTASISTNVATLTVACAAGTVPAGGNQRDAFPDCFQGDEIHFEMTYVPCANPATCTKDTLINNWFTKIDSFA